jgi:hypothetical protein
MVRQGGGLFDSQTAGTGETDVVARRCFNKHLRTNCFAVENPVLTPSRYPFHLRPKNKQAVQYIRMVVDIISDLELDEDPGIDSMDIPPTPERLDQIRLYLASYYLVSAYDCLFHP